MVANTQKTQDAKRSAGHVNSGASHLAYTLCAGPFASLAGVGRADPEWADLNQVKGIMGKDTFATSGETSEAPLQLPPVRDAACQRRPLPVVCR